MSTLAIDNGLNECGWAVVDVLGKPLELGVIVLEADPDANGGIQRDRIKRTREQGVELFAVAKRHRITRVAVETMSFPRFGKFTPIDPVAALCLSTGLACGLSVALDVPITDVAPKEWQNAMLGTKGKVDYDVVYAALADYVRDLGTTTCHVELEAIAPSLRNHPLDAIGVGVYAEILQPPQGVSS